MTPEEMVARVLYRDGLMLVIDKPAGLAVHRGPKGGESLENFFTSLRFGLPRAPALAHRLDRDTSGCLVLGRHRKALAQLGQLFKNGRVGKTYWTVVEGGPDAHQGRIELALGRLDPKRGWWMKADASGQPAVTTWKVMGRGVIRAAAADGERRRDSPPVPSVLVAEGVGWGSATVAESGMYPPPQPSPTRREGAGRVHGASLVQDQKLTWLALEPLTGRTHQLRVHCAAMGWPIVGDAIYGSAPRQGGPKLHLHAREIVLPLYKNREAIRVAAPVPAHMQALLAASGWAGEDAAPVNTALP